MNQPKISVIVPVYNPGKYLSGTLDSLVASTYKNLEIILIDNGSTDGSDKICENYAQNDERIILIHTENRGVSAARNTGLEIASGEWVGFLDSDDKIDADMYEYLMSGATEHGADVVQCGVYKEFEDRTEIVNAPKTAIITASENDMTKEFWRYFAFSVWSKIYKSDLAKSLRFNPEYTIGEDLRYNFEALVKSKKTLLLPCPKYHYLQRSGSACNSLPSEKNVTSFAKMLKDAAVDFDEHKEMADFIFCEAMRNNAHVCSRIVVSRSEGFDAVTKKIRDEIKANRSRLMKADGISAKDKIKLLLIAYGWNLYVWLLRAKKPSLKEVS